MNDQTLRPIGGVFKILHAIKLSVGLRRVGQVG